MNQTSRKSRLFSFLLTPILAFAMLASPGMLGQQAMAAEAAPLIQSGAGKGANITIYGNGFAQIEESRTVDLKAGMNRIQLDGISTQYVPDSLRIVTVDGTGKFTYKSSTYQSANMNRGTILKKSIGETVLVYIDTAAGLQALEGTLLSVSGGQMVVSNPTNGETMLTNSANVALKKMPEGLSNSASLVVEANVDVAGSYEMKFFYESRGMGWSAKHSLIYNEKAAQIDDFQTTFNVVNGTGTSFEDANLWLLSGDVPLNSPRLGRTASAGYSFDQAATTESASVESVGERKVYKITGMVDLIEGQRQIPFLLAKNVPVEKEFVLNSSDYRFQNSQTLIPVNARLNLKNCVENHLGVPLPAASVKVFQANSDGVLQATASAAVKEIAVDEEFSVALGTSSDVKASVKMKSATEVKMASNAIPQGQYNRPPKWQDQEWQIKVHNFKTDKDVDVTVIINLPADHDDIQPFVRKSATVAETSVAVTKAAAKDLTYTKRVRIQ